MQYQEPIMVTKVLIFFLFAYLIVSSEGTLDCDGIPCDAEVLILGAGMSGFAAAYKLNQNTNGIDGTERFLILEASNRIGGRLHKMNFNGATIELGANWIQGLCKDSSCNPVWLQAKRRLGCVEPTCESTDRSDLILYDLSGNRLDINVLDTYPEDDLDSYSNSNNNDISVRVGLEKFNWFLPDNDAKKKFADWYKHDNCFAELPEHTSLLRTHPLPTYENFGSDEYFVSDTRGFEHILTDLLSTDDRRIRLNTEVRKIRNRANSVCVDTNRKTYCGRFAIVTFSIGVLKANLNMFEPPLSQQKVNAINSFSMALYLKIFLHFPTKFWDDAEFIGRASTTRGHYPLFVPINNNIIMAIVTSPFSNSVSKQSDDETVQQVMAALRQIYPPNTVPNPDNYKIAHWDKDPHFLGAYSNTPVGVTDDTHRNLAKQEGRLFFAGEAASIEYSGFVHGAYYAGVSSGSGASYALSYENVVNSTWFKIVIPIAAILIVLVVLYCIVSVSFRCGKNKYACCKNKCEGEVCSALCLNCECCCDCWRCTR